MSERDFEQKIVTNVQASPLASATPDFLISGLIKLGRSYLQSKNVAYLGNAIKMLRPFAGSLCKAQGIETYDEMINTCPEVNKAIEVLHLASTSNETLFGAPKTFPTSREQQMAENAARFHNEMLDQMEISFDLERQKCVYDALRYSNGICELEYGTGYGLLEDKVVIKQMRAADTKDVVFVTDSFNRVIGYAPYGFPGVIAPLDAWVPADSFFTFLMEHYEAEKRHQILNDTKILPKFKCLHLQWGARSNDPRGGSLLDAAFQPWWAKQQIMPILLYFLEHWSVPRKKGNVAEKVDYVTLFDANNEEIIVNGRPKQVPALIKFTEELDKWGAGGTLATPFGYDSELLEANPQMVDVILKALDFFNREISSAITKQFLTSGQGLKSGGEKGVQSHRDVLSLIILKLKNVQSVGIREQISKVLTRANFGKASTKYAPKVDLGDADGFPVSLDELGFLAQSMKGFFTEEMFPEVGRKVGFPYIPSKRKVRFKKSAAKDVAQLTALLQGQLACGEGTFTVEFED